MKMKKIILVMLGVMMIMSLVGCGSNGSKDISTEEYYVNSNTGEKIKIETSIEKTYDYYAIVKNVKHYDNGKTIYQFEYKIDEITGYSTYEIENDTLSLEKNDTVKIICGWNTTDNKPNFQSIISVEKIVE